MAFTHDYSHTTWSKDADGAAARMLAGETHWKMDTAVRMAREHDLRATRHRLRHDVRSMAKLDRCLAVYYARIVRRANEARS